MRALLPVGLLALASCATGPPLASPQPIDEDGAAGGVAFQVDGREVAVLTTRAVPPVGVDEVYARDGHLHPIRTPSGVVVTGAYHAAHRHQHGVFSAWRSALVGDREVDFWNLGARTGDVRVAGVDVADGVGLTVEHLVPEEGGAPRVALRETWRITAQGGDETTRLDLELRQLPVDGDVTVLEFDYGGFAWRGPEGWEGANCRFRTSERRGRHDGNGTRANWVVASGYGDGALSSIAILSHPSNFRSPQPVRLHPTEPYFCFAPSRDGPFAIDADTPYEARYRILAFDGAPDLEWLDEEWEAFAAE